LYAYRSICTDSTPNSGLRENFSVYDSGDSDKCCTQTDSKLIVIPKLTLIILEEEDVIGVVVILVVVVEILVMIVHINYYCYLIC